VITAAIAKAIGAAVCAPSNWVNPTDATQITLKAKGSTRTARLLPPREGAVKGPFGVGDCRGIWPPLCALRHSAC